MQQATLSPPTINFKKERSFSEKLNATFAFLSQNLKPIAKSMAFVAGPFVILIGLCYGIFPTFIFNPDYSGPNPFEISGFQPLLFGAIFGIFLLSLVAGTLVIAIILRHIRTYVEQGHTDINPGNLWRTIWKDFFSVLGTSIFVVVALFFAWLGIAMLGALLTSFIFNFFMVILIFIGQFVGFICVYSALLLLFPIRFVERKNVFSAFSRMFRLNSGKWFSTAGLIMVTFIIQVVVTIAFALPLYLLTFLRMYHLTENQITGGQNDPVSILYSVLFSISGAVFIGGAFSMNSLVIIASSFQYFNLVEQKEAKGLFERMESFGRQKQELNDHDEQY